MIKPADKPPPDNPVAETRSGDNLIADVARRVTGLVAPLEVAEALEKSSTKRSWCDALSAAVALAGQALVSGGEGTLGPIPLPDGQGLSLYTVLVKKVPRAQGTEPITTADLALRVAEQTAKAALQRAQDAAYIATRVALHDVRDVIWRTTRALHMLGAGLGRDVLLDPDGHTEALAIPARGLLALFRAMQDRPSPPTLPQGPALRALLEAWTKNPALAGRDLAVEAFATLLAADLALADHAAKRGSTETMPDAERAELYRKLLLEERDDLAELQAAMAPANLPAGARTIPAAAKLLRELFARLGPTKGGS